MLEKECKLEKIRLRRAFEHKSNINSSFSTFKNIFGKWMARGWPPRFPDLGMATGRGWPQVEKYRGLL